MAVSESRGVRLRITTNSRHLEDDECGWVASGIHRTLGDRYLTEGNKMDKLTLQLHTYFNSIDMKYNSLLKDTKKRFIEVSNDGSC